MNNNRGSAIALVLMILAVVSLIGVGLITLARNDVKFTAALKSYDKMFGLADGASAMAVYYLAIREGDKTREVSITQTGVPMTIFQDTELRLGDHIASVVLEGVGTYEPGFDIDYYPQYWNAQGTGRRLTGQMVVDAATRKMEVARH